MATVHFSMPICASRSVDKEALAATAVSSSGLGRRTHGVVIGAAHQADKDEPLAVDLVPLLDRRQAVDLEVIGRQFFLTAADEA
jgi:hypothetical protein